MSANGLDQLLRAAEVLQSRPQHPPRKEPVPISTAPESSTTTTRRAGGKRKRSNSDTLDTTGSSKRQLRKRRATQLEAKVKTEKPEEKDFAAWCELCGRGFGREAERSRHMGDQHDPDRKYFCQANDRCSHEWTPFQYSNHKSHLIKQHGMKIADMCKHCSKTSEVSGGMDGHECVPPVPSYKCSTKWRTAKSLQSGAGPVSAPSQPETSTRKSGRKTGKTSANKDTIKAKAPDDEDAASVASTEIVTPFNESSPRAILPIIPTFNSRSAGTSDSGYYSGHEIPGPSTGLDSPSGTAPYPFTFHAEPRPPYRGGQLRTASWAPENDRYHNNSYRNYAESTKDSDDEFDDDPRPSSSNTQWPAETPYYRPSQPSAEYASPYSYPYPHSYSSGRGNAYTPSLAPVSSPYSYTPAGPSSSVSTSASAPYTQSTRYRQPHNCSCNCDAHRDGYRNHYNRYDGHGYDPRY